MSDVCGQPAELRMVVQIKRAATGITETVELIGRTTVEQAQAAGITEQKEEHGNDTQHSGT